MKNEIINQLTAKQAHELANKIYSERVESEQTKFLNYCFVIIKETHEKGEFEAKFNLEEIKDQGFPQIHKYINVIISTLTNDHFEYKVSLIRKNNASDGLILFMTVSF